MNLPTDPRTEMPIETWRATRSHPAFHDIYINMTVEHEPDAQVSMSNEPPSKQAVSDKLGDDAAKATGEADGKQHPQVMGRKLSPVVRYDVDPEHRHSIAERSRQSQAKEASSQGTAYCHRDTSTR